MPASPASMRVRIGLFFILIPDKRTHASHNMSLSHGWQNRRIFSFFLSFFLAALALLVLKKYRVKPPVSSPKIVFSGFVCFSLCLRLLLLSGDVHPNPGPDLSGKLRFGHWNLNSLLTRNKSKISLIEALQASENFDLFGISESFLNDKTKKKITLKSMFFPLIRTGLTALV